MICVILITEVDLFQYLSVLINTKVVQKETVICIMYN